ncbi:hypothetical protein E7T06_09440 [Deinococcus sp. Arct2-2]|uniref:TniB family NTP-binding protein n=1 Tax=Deinococcus sp. Arct2-2 TaxID=2568653 RepID=UPI0010A30BEC|nr:TniB family NTP-binding protein [Deinococcus sp. Arct2-2]THF69970.1 hypothetical protein E7T06_09440 [Deinococcus sp. Arct2-2]
MTGGDLSRRLFDDNSILTREDWAAYCAHQSPERPPRLTPAEYAALDDQERRRYNRRRAAWHADWGLNTTSTMVLARQEFAVIAEKNFYSHDPVKDHVALSGPPTLGKTTIAQILGRDFEIEVRVLLEERGVKLEDLDEFQPVLYLSITSETTTDTLNRQMLLFLGTPISVSKEYRKGDLELAVAETLRRHGVRLIIPDDVHLLRPGRRNTEGVHSYLKALSSRAPIMLLMVGIDLEKTNLFDELRHKDTVEGGQTGGRTTLLPVGRFAKGSPEWLDLVRWVDDQLVLLHHPPGRLLRLKDYLWNRTQGGIGSLMSLIRRAALKAVVTEHEQISRQLIDLTTADYNAEKHGNREVT